MEEQILNMHSSLQEYFGDIDIYLFDQILKGRFNGCKTILDVGCGNGRNVVYFLRQSFEVYGIDKSPEAIAQVKELAQQLAPQLPVENFRVGLVEEMPFPDNTFDLVICSAVLHFARNEDHFDKMLRSIWRVLKPGGFMFARLASSIGLEHIVRNLGNKRYYLPDGSERFLVDEPMLLNYTTTLNGELFEYLKTTNVQNLRCMTTWCVRKK